jgi:hypothetical protein
VEERTFVLHAPTRLGPPAEHCPETTLWVRSPLSLGLLAGKWCSYAAPPDLPHDQRGEDGGALWFETDSLAEPVEILGAPYADLELSVDQPVAMVAVRLSDVAPDGEATRVTYGVLNLTHRHGHDRPETLVPGQRYAVRVRLNDIAQSFPRGHRIRLSISTSYFPLAWPPPRPVTLRLHTRVSTLVLPVRCPGDPDPPELRDLGSPVVAPPPPLTVLDASVDRWRVIHDLAEDTHTLEVIKDGGWRRFDDTGWEFGSRTEERYSHRRKDFDSARGEVITERRFRRGAWNVRTRTRTVLTCDETHLRIHATLDAYEGTERVRSRNWTYTIPRDHL